MQGASGPRPMRLAWESKRVHMSTACSVWTPERPAKLVSMLKEQTPHVTIAPLMFGATGTIYAPTRDTLIQLGVPHAAATHTLGKIHAALCRHVQSIVGARRAKGTTAVP